MQEPGMQNLKCPKCPGVMRTYERSGVRIEQCDTCRGIFLDFGELEALTRMEGQFSPPTPPPPPPAPHAPYPQQAPYPPQPAPGWGAPAHGGYHQGHRRGGFGRLFYSS
ncbi:MAG: uncharacterized protein QG608_276 [Actinomycetota bacterium]|nr:uncharacterized protein [Actinomycetota bacterium]